MPHISDHLHGFLSNALPPPDRAFVEAHLVECAECACLIREFVSLNAGLEPFTSPRRPPPQLRSRLLEAVDHLERFAVFAPRLGALLGASTNDARRAFHAFSDVDLWASGPIPGMRVFPLPLAAKCAGETAMLACFAKDTVVPCHRHLGAETVLVFQGAFQTDDGQVVSAGEELHSPAGSTHSIVRFLGGIECLCAIFKHQDPSLSSPPGSHCRDASTEASR